MNLALIGQEAAFPRYIPREGLPGQDRPGPQGGGYTDPAAVPSAPAAPNPPTPAPAGLPGPAPLVRDCSPGIGGLAAGAWVVPTRYTHPAIPTRPALPSRPPGTHQVHTARTRVSGGL